MRSNYRRMLDDLYDFIEAKFRAFQAYRIARRQLKNLHGGLNDRKGFRKIVAPFWKKYGEKPSSVWFRLYGAKDGKLNPYYIPESIWFGKIIPYYSNTRFRRALEDKCFHGVWFADCKRPDTVVRNIAGLFYDEDYKLISKEQAVEKCLAYDDFLIKPSIDSGEGRLIQFFDKTELTEEIINKAFSEFGSNFMVQQVLKQHPDLAKLNPDSINTVRVVSFLFKGEVHILSSIVRVGGAGSRIDNFCAGGYSCRITESGRLSEEAVTKKMTWCKTSHTGVDFHDVEVPSYDKIIEIIKRKHPMFPHFKIIGWDFSVNPEGEPVFIEYNCCPGQNQEDCGPTFGSLTEEVLEDVFITREYAGSGN